MTESGVEVGDGELLLIVDDDAVFRAQFARTLRRRGFRVLTAENFDEAVAAAEEYQPPRAVVDLRMPGKGGLELVQCLTAMTPPTEVVVLTGYGSIATALEAVKLGAKHYLTKPSDADDVLRAFDDGLALKSQGASAAPKAPSLARAEWEHINRVLADTGGNISEAARRLGLQRRSLQRKLKVPPPD